MSIRFASQIDMRSAPPFRRFAELDAPLAKPHRVTRVATARVVFLDHDLLVSDLPALAGHGPFGSPREAKRYREHWLLEQAGVISIDQAPQTVVNTPILTSGGEREVWRPPLYGRAVVLPAHVEIPGRRHPASLLLDLKGAGIGPGRITSLHPHSSGLCTLGEALRETLFQRLISTIFHHAAPEFWTVPVYGVIDLGFDVKNRRSEQVPAGLLVRRAHRRHIDGFVLPARGSVRERLALEIELLLRHYGLTTTNPGTRFLLDHTANGWQVTRGGAAPILLDSSEEYVIPHPLRQGPFPVHCDGINVQFTRPRRLPGIRAELVDFGNYEVRQDFTRPLISTVGDAPSAWGATLLPNDPQYVHPHPALRLPPKHWARVAEESAMGASPRSASDPPTHWANQAAHDFRTGKLSGDAIAASITTAIRAAVP